jgi:glycosyltransferase involved in cell wall biosynthesis
VKLACVIHRFGADIAGGSEGHCRAVAEHLAAAHDVTVLTTCAKDHITWRNHYPPGESRVGRLRVLRFPVARERRLGRFLDLNDRVAVDRATPEEQDDWFRENGPDAPALLQHLGASGRDYDRILFWSFRYADTFFGLPLVADRAILLPTAEDDTVVRLDALDRFFALPRGFLFLTPEEEALVGSRRSSGSPSEVIGVGLDPATESADRSPLANVHLPGSFFLYLGRVDPNKGCDALLRHFRRYADERPNVSLVLAGPAAMPVPEHPAVRPLGFVSEGMREALLASAKALVMPSPYESLSIVVLEAWNRALPVLVNGRCKVLRGQVERAGGGLYYATGAEFGAALDYLLDHPDDAAAFGRQGLSYVEREYRWPVVLDKIERILAATRS